MASFSSGWRDRLFHQMWFNFPDSTSEKMLTAAARKTPAILRGPRRDFFDVDGAITLMLRWTALPTNTKTLIFMIPGNPGVIDYYQEFLQCLYACTAAQVDIVGVQHAGHMVHAALDKPNLDSGAAASNAFKVVSRHLTPAELFDRRHHQYQWSLEEQIEHKLSLLDHLVRTEYQTHKIVLAGHSVGAYIATQILGRRPEYHHRIVDIINLFPTLENIRDTPNGKRLWPLFHPLGRSFLSASASFLKLLPRNILHRMVSIMTQQSHEDARITTNLVDPNVAQNTLYMAYTEMEDIGDLDLDFYRRHYDKMTFYYGQDDDWAPMEHYERMKARFLNGRVHLCQRGLPHAFVLGNGGLELAELVSEWISHHHS